jgi:hypothetical protein
VGVGGDRAGVVGARHAGIAGAGGGRTGVGGDYARVAGAHRAGVAGAGGGRHVGVVGARVGLHHDGVAREP